MKCMQSAFANKINNGNSLPQFCNSSTAENLTRQNTESFSESLYLNWNSDRRELWKKSRKMTQLLELVCSEDDSTAFVSWGPITASSSEHEMKLGDPVPAELPQNEYRGTSGCSFISPWQRSGPPNSFEIGGRGRVTKKKHRKQNETITLTCTDITDTCTSGGVCI